MQPPVFAARMSSNLDPEEDQPVQRGERSLWFDGEIYNREDLWTRLQRPAGTDSELVLALMDGDTPDHSDLREIDGQFCAVLHDAAAQRLHLITDRYGLRPLYWSRQADRLLWSSEVKAFPQFPGFPVTLDRAALQEFFGIGYLLEDRTWLEAVKLLPAACVMTWDLRLQRLDQNSYWSFREIPRLMGRPDLPALAERMGELFVAAVERRCRSGEQIGLTLSGGLDSRAVLAAIPKSFDPIHAVTFGQRGCADIRIAARAARRRGALHHAFEIDTHNWLPPRVEGGWALDGHLNLMHMHSIHLRGWAERFFRINLHPFAGDMILGGSYLTEPQLDRAPAEVWPQLLDSLRRCNTLYDPAALSEQVEQVASGYETTDTFWLANRVRRFTLNGPMCLEPALVDRKPTFDNALMEFALGLPQELRFEGRIYHAMLLRFFPDYYRSIPWQKTGLPIAAGPIRQRIQRRIDWGHALLQSRYPNAARRFGVRHYSDYDGWTSTDPARTELKELLLHPDARWPQYLSPHAGRRLIDNHFAGSKLDSEGLLLLATFELLLHRLFP